MRSLILIALLANISFLQAQSLLPKSIYASYFGVTVTHPGLRIGVTYQLESWDKTITRKNGDKRIIQKSIELSPSVGFFYHKDYQTGLFVLPELSYLRKNAKGNFWMAGLGAGYMRTFLPNVYHLNSNGEIESTGAGYNYLLTNYSITFGKDLSVKKMIPLSLYIKPQFMYAIPNATKGVSYFALELGASYKWIKSKQNGG